jgi:anaerobic selenocysteine-containing dehydrogenase
MFEPAYQTRRQALKNAACGFAYLALAGLPATKPLPPPIRLRLKRRTSSRARSGSFFCSLQGGVSHVDSYDYKPRLEKDDGKMMDFDDARTLAKTGQNSTQRVMKSPWKFSQHGQCGRWSRNFFHTWRNGRMIIACFRECKPKGLLTGLRRYSCTPARQT